MNKNIFSLQNKNAIFIFRILFWILILLKYNSYYFKMIDYIGDLNKIRSWHIHIKFRIMRFADKKNIRALIKDIKILFGLCLRLFLQSRLYTT